jgi:hypothetical protein
MALAAIGVLGMAGLALGIAAVVQAGSHDAPNREARQQLAQVRQATAKYQDFHKACEDGYSILLGDHYVPGMGLHFWNGEFIGDVEAERTEPQVLLYVPRGPEGKERVQLVAVEYLAYKDEVPPELFSGVSQNGWDPTPIPNVEGLHAWIWLGNPDGVFSPTSPVVPADGHPVYCP